jgi:hypothetical protein
MRAWFRARYFDRRTTDGEIAGWLSVRFVPVAPMNVYRFASQVLAFKAYRRGTRPVGRQGRTGQAADDSGSGSTNPVCP